jgi:hypothetical protein
MPPRPMSLPGDLWCGCLSLGNAPDLLEAFALLREQEGSSCDDKERAVRRAVDLILDATEKALASPAGKRLYPEEAYDADDPADGSF